MNRLLFILSILAVVGVSAACRTAQASVLTIDALDGEWTVVDVGGKTVAGKSDSRPFLGFSARDRRLYGNAGCNNLMGVVEVDETTGAVSFSNVGRTRMRCADMTTERRIVDALDKTVSCELDADGLLLLKSADGETVMRLKKK